MLEVLQNIAMWIADRLVAAIPQRAPETGRLRSCRIVSHRGEFDNRSVLENTLDAFRRASSQGVWGLECDIRWTADLVPVICHDPDTGRVFGAAVDINQSSYAELRAQVPQVPSLAEVVAEFGGRNHLMLEIKADAYPHPQRQAEILRETLRSLCPVEDFHFLALDPALFTHVPDFPTTALLPVAELNVNRLSETALDYHMGGLTGHYLMLTRSTLLNHQTRDQQVGTGFIGSRNCLYRELNRGVDWIFSNDAVRLQKIVDEELCKRQ